MSKVLKTDILVLNKGLDKTMILVSLNISSVQKNRIDILGPFHKNLNNKITIHTWDIFILLEKHHQCHCMPTNYSYDYI